MSTCLERYTYCFVVGSSHSFRTACNFDATERLFQRSHHVHLVKMKGVLRLRAPDLEKPRGAWRARAEEAEPGVAPLL